MLIRNKFNGFSATGQRLVEVSSGGGGGGGGQPTQTTAYQTNLPEYAKPYVTTMLEATQKQLFNTRPGADGTTEITGFKPYVPYSTDPTKYFAGPTDLQQMGYREAQRMATPTQFAPATGLATASGAGQLGTAQQALGLGAQGVGIGQMGMAAAAPAFGAGQQFMRGVTDPSQVSAFMSPYQQAVTDVAKAAAVREAQMANQAANLASARQGTYGGARQALQQSERERNLLANLSNIQAQGAQSAYDRALAQMQFGSNLGLQGIQTGLQGVQAGMQGIGQGLQGVGAQQAGFAGAGQAGATLGNLGTAQQAADVSRIGLQQQLGAAQQQYQQNIINQAIQDYATAQQYPMMQLGFMSNMLRGLPMQATTTQSYMPTPSLGTQAIAGLGTLYGVGKGTGMFKEGGEIKGYAGPEGSIVSGMRAKLEALADGPNGVQQVAQIAQSSPSAEMRKLANEVLIEKRMEEQAAAQAEASIAKDQMPRGLAAAPAPVLDTMEAASGGIVAFANEGEVEYDPNKVYADPYQVLSDAEAIARAKGRRQAMGIGEVISPEYKKYIEEQRGGLGGLKERATGWDIADIFGGMYQSALERPGQGLIGQLTSGAAKASPSIRERQRELRNVEKDIATMGQDVYGRERADQMAILTGTEKERADALKRISDRKEKELAARNARIDSLDKTTATYFNQLIAPPEQGGAGKPNNAATQLEARRLALEATLGGRLGAGVEDKITKAWEKIDDAFFSRRLQAFGDPKALEKVEAEIEAAKEAEAARIRGGSKTPGGGAPSAAPAAAPKSGSVLDNTVLPPTTTGPNGKTLYLHPDNMYRAFKPR